ncbi:hypothetical protein [Paraburkholderia kururiensis]
MMMKKRLISAAAMATLVLAMPTAFADGNMPDAAQHADAGAQSVPDLPQHLPPHPAGPDFAVVNDLEQLHRLYAMSGRESQIVAVYHEVLNRTQDPMLRHYVYDSLARIQLKPDNVDQAIATLHTSLNEDLVALNRAPHLPASRGMPEQAPASPE